MTDKEFKKRVKAIRKRLDAFEDKNPSLKAFNWANEVLNKLGLPQEKVKKIRGI